MVFLQTEMHKSRCTESKDRVKKKKRREGCALDMSSVGVAFLFKNTHEIPSEVTGKCPSASAQGKIRPIIFSFPEKPSAL